MQEAERWGGREGGRERSTVEGVRETEDKWKEVLGWKEKIAYSSSIKFYFPPILLAI